MTRLPIVAGDVIFSVGASRLARAIRWAQTSRKEERTLVNHVIICTQGSFDPGYSWIVESDHRVRLGHLGEFHSKDYCLAFRPRNITDTTLDAIVQAALRRVGEHYGYLQLLPQLIDNKLFGNRVIARKLSAKSKAAVCSRLVAEAFGERGYDFGIPGFAADPDTMFDFCRDNPNKYYPTWQGFPTFGAGW